MSDDFEQLLGRLDSDDQETRHHAIEQLEAAFRESHTRRETPREELRSLLNRWDADEAAELALAEVSNPDPMQPRRNSSPAPQMPDDRLIEIEAHHLGPLPEDLADRAVALYLDAIDDIRDLVSEVARLRATVGQPSATELGSSNPIDREPVAPVRSHVRSTRSGPCRIPRRPAAEVEVMRDEPSPVESAVSSEGNDQADGSLTTNASPIAKSVDRAWNAPVFTGTRVPVDVMFEYLEAGDGLAEFLLQFPTVDRSRAVAVLELARSAVRLAAENAEPPETEQVAVGVRFTKRHICVELAEGWDLRVPTGRFRWLRAAKRKQRLNVVITAGGRNLRWPALDEDLGVAGLVQEFASANCRPSKPSEDREASDRRMDRVHDRSWELFALSEGSLDPMRARPTPRSPGTHLSDDRLTDIEERYLGSIPGDLSDQAAARYLDATDDIAALVSEIWRLRAEVGPLPATDAGASEPDDRMTGEGASMAELILLGDSGPPDLAAEFELQLRELLESWPSKARENSEWLRDLVEVRGGIAAARIWLSLDRRTRIGRKAPVGGHIDAAINGLILGAEFESLFTSRERTIAWYRLARKKGAAPRAPPAPVVSQMPDNRLNPSPGISPSRWQRLSLDEQLANLGTDVARAARAKEAGDSKRLATWLAMMRAEFALTLSDPRLESERPEIERMRMVVEDFLDGKNAIGSSAASLDEFFVPFALRANDARRSRREHPDRSTRPGAIPQHDREG